jgi:hypothetical protein
MILFALGHGSATLLMVILVPRMLPPHLVSLGLGLHKSMEMASSTLSQTVAGVWLDWAKGQDEEQQEYQAGQGLLLTFLGINVLQLGCAVVLWKLWARRARELAPGMAYERLPLGELGGEGDEDDELDDLESVRNMPLLGRTERVVEEVEEVLKSPQMERTLFEPAITKEERKWGRIFSVSSLGFILLVWAVFFATAWTKM